MTSKYQHSYSHTSKIFIGVSDQTPPEEKAHKGTIYVSSYLVDLQSYFNPNAPMYKSRSFQSTLKDWSKAIQKIEDPNVKAAKVVEALAKWTVNVDSVGMLQRMPQKMVVSGFIQGFEKSGCPHPEIYGPMAMKRQAVGAGQALVFARRELNDLIKHEPQALAEALKGIEKRDFDRIVQYMRKTELKDLPQVNFTKDSGMHYGLFDSEPPLQDGHTNEHPEPVMV